MNKEEITDEEIKKIIQFYYDGCDNFDYEREYTRKLEVYINQLKQKAELGDHYKHLYSEVKKQKDDVVEYIKKYLQEHIIDDLPDEESKFETENGIPIPNAKEILLRMLGEIDDNKGNDE